MHDEIVDEIIIGAGPIGSYYASQKNCLILEQKKMLEVGEPVQCTGLVSRNIEEFVKIPKSIIQNKIRGAILHSPNNSVQVKKENVAYVINRKKFDQYLLEKALENSKIMFGEQVKEYYKTKNYVQIRTEKNTYRTKKLIDASGPKTQKNFLMGLQITAKMEREPIAELFFGNEVCPEFFAWIVPENEEVCRIGVATRSPRIYLDKLLDKLGNPKILDWQGGIIPMHKPVLRGESETYLLGDRGGHVKPTTGGGLITGLKSAKLLAHSKNYEKEWNKTIGKELLIHWRIRNFLDKINDEELDELIELVKHLKPKLEKHGNMDYPSKFLTKLITPKTIKFFAKNFSKII
ncbi:MAG: NAD(P)/FAD-dependent oxidoreductase [Nanoarchaeota archaeon]|nr:NAD(P)/FAD-dependent oxidoreductase [Nanoarchaeota archaeon]